MIHTGCPAAVPLLESAIVAGFGGRPALSGAAWAFACHVNPLIDGFLPASGTRAAARGGVTPSIPTCPGPQA
jgi:hypothetical protein